MADVSEERDREAKSRSRSRGRYFYRNPFLNFLREFRELPENQKVPSKDLFVLAGRKWRSLSESEREFYVLQAQMAKKEFASRKAKKESAWRRRPCSRCGHRHGSPNGDDSDGNTSREDQSPTRSRSPSGASGSKSDSKSGSATTGDDFTEDTETMF